MAFDLESISNGSGLRPPRIVLLGIHKIGKSEFAAKSDSPIFIPIKGEEGIDAIKVPQFPTCNSLGDVLSCLNTLYTREHNHSTVVIDSASTLEPIVWDDVCRNNGNVSGIEKVGGGYGKGYTEALSVWRKLTEILDFLRKDRNMASIIVGHVKAKRFDDPCGDSYDQWQFDINDRAANLLYRWADCILFCNTKVIVKKESAGFNQEKGRAIDLFQGARFLYTQMHPAHPGGGRGAFGKLPYELPLDWSAFTEAVASVS